MLKYCRAQSGQAYPSVHLDIWLVRYPYLWDIELNTSRGTLGLQAIKYYFFYFINTIGLYWQEKEQMNEWVNDWKEKDPKSTKCGGTKVQDEKMRRIISKTNDGCNFQLTESSVIAFSRAHGLWKIFQSIFVLSRKKSRYQSQLTYGVSFRILVSFRFYNRRPNCWHIHLFNPLLLQFYLPFPSVS